MPLTQGPEGKQAPYPDSRTGRSGASKTNWKFIAIVIVLAVIVGGGILGYFGYFKREMISLTKFLEIKKPETANWKTYSIGDFQCGYIGYEIKYSPDLEVKGWEDEPLARCPAATLHIVSFVKIKDSKKIEVLTIDTKSDPDQLIYKSYESEGAVPIKINEIDGLQIKEDRFALPKSEKLYIISTENYLEVKELFNQMRSTFQFIEIDETANWKTYRNEEYGFEIKYPKDWSYAKDIVRSSVSSPSMVFCSPDYYDPIEGCKLKRVQYVTTNLAEIRLFIGKWSNLPAYLGETKEEKKEGEMNCDSDIETRTINEIDVEICRKANGDYSALWEDSTGLYLYHLHGFYEKNPEIFNLMLSTFRFLE